MKSIGFDRVDTIETHYYFDVFSNYMYDKDTLPNLLKEMKKHNWTLKQALSHRYADVDEDELHNLEYEHKEKKGQIIISFDDRDLDPNEDMNYEEFKQWCDEAQEEYKDWDNDDDYDEED